MHLLVIDVSYRPHPVLNL